MAGAVFGQPQFGQNQPGFVRQGQQLIREGKLDEALQLYRSNLAATPDSLPGNTAAGILLDLMGRGDEARTYFQKAIDFAGSPAVKANAQRAMAMSWAFSGNCRQTVKYEQMVF